MMMMIMETIPMTVEVVERQIILIKTTYSILLIIKIKYKILSDYLCMLRLWMVTFLFIF